MKTKILLFLVISLTLFSCKKTETTPEDWPQYKKDNFRSAHSPVKLDLADLGEEWQYTSSQMPSPAWYGPAKEDAYAQSGPLPSMRDYDLSYYPIVVGSKLYYGSTADDAIHCLNTKTGKEEWLFTTGGPIRIAPVFYKGNLYFGSDDGYAYCIDASDGDLIWKFSPKKDQTRKVLNNNSLISFWPVRTGILIEDDIAYFGASLLPWKTSYFCAINTKTGKPDKAGTYIKEYDNLTMEGAMASTGTKIIQPQGRISPMIFNKKTGEHKGQLAGSGGCFVLVTPEKNIVYYNTSREKSIAETSGQFAKIKAESDKKKGDLMSFKGGKEMLVKDSISYILTDNSISAYDRKSKKVIWLRRNYQAHRIILSGNTIFAGATDTIYAVSTANGLPLWKAPVKGTVYALAVADKALFASTREGKIYCFRNGHKKNPLLEKNLNKPAEIEKETKPIPEKTVENFEFAAGPFVNINDPNSIEIHFITKKPAQCRIKWWDPFEKRTITEDQAGTDHRITINGLRKDFNYNYQILTDTLRSKVFEFDNMFNYSQPKISASKDQSSVSEYLKYNPSNKGICLVFGTKNKDLALDIARASEMKSILFETSAHNVDNLRKEWQNTGIYGGKVSAHQVKDYSKIPMTGNIAELVLVTNRKSSADEIIRLIKPGGYAILKGDPSGFNEWLSKAEQLWQVEVKKENSGIYLKKREPDHIGKWTHQYGLADNSAFGGESLWGSTSTEDFEVQWMGRPGPRFQTDRSGRKPSPLAVKGKLFVQGKERVLAIDSYNGKIFWSKEIPGMVRMNLHHDCSNWAADDDHLYIAVNENLLKLNNNNGFVEKIIPVEKSKKNLPNEWGYIAALDDEIIGSSTQKGSAFKNYHGGAGWYDGQTGPLTYKVVSFNLFALDKNANKIWKYEKPNSAIINSTITINGDQISFVESRNPRLKLTKEGRGKNDLFKDLYLVSLDVHSGKLNWEKRLDTEPGITTYFMASGKDYLVIVSSFKGAYYIYTYDAKNGELVWKTRQSWFSDNHGGHLSRPAIVKNKLIVKPVIYKLDSGEKLKIEIPKAGHGCASYALSEQSTFYRGGSVTQFNFDTDKFSKWERLRPDCWISTIPAEGMVLSPEAGGGCSCGNWLETSMVFAPVSRAPISLIYKDEHFIDSLKIEIKPKDAANKEIYYTLDGTTPTKESTKYTNPIIISENSVLNAAIYVKKGDKEVPFIRTKEFTRKFPAPSVLKNPQLINGQWVFFIEKNGVSGKIHYTTDGSEPGIHSPEYTKPVPVNNKTLIKAKTFWKINGKVISSKETSTEIEIPELIESVSAETKPGIIRKFYKVNLREMPDFKLVKPDDIQIAEQIDVKSFGKQGKFALHFTGYIDIPKDGLYTFYDKSDGESYFYLHGKKVLTNEDRSEKNVMIGLKKGLHPVRMDYKIWRGNPLLDFQIEGPEISKAPIPAKMLTH